MQNITNYKVQQPIIGPYIAPVQISAHSHNLFDITPSWKMQSNTQISVLITKQLLFLYNTVTLW